VLPVLVGHDTVSGHLIVARTSSVWTGFTPEWILTPLLAIVWVTPRGSAAAGGVGTRGHGSRDAGYYAGDGQRNGRQ
jgi:hypothetical protein